MYFSKGDYFSKMSFYKWGLAFLDEVFRSVFLILYFCSKEYVGK